MAGVGWHSVVGVAGLQGLRFGLRTQLSLTRTVSRLQHQVVQDARGSCWDANGLSGGHIGRAGRPQMLKLHRQLRRR